MHLSDGRCSLGSHSVPDRSVEEDAGLRGNALHLSPGVPALTCGPELQALTERMRSGTRADNAGFLRRCSASERVGGGQTSGTGPSRWFQRLSWPSPVRLLPPWRLSGHTQIWNSLEGMYLYLLPWGNLGILWEELDSITHVGTGCAGCADPREVEEIRNGNMNLLQSRVKHSRSHTHRNDRRHGNRPSQLHVGLFASSRK